MLTWLAPFVFTAGIACFYFFAPVKNAEQTRDNMRKNINFYLIANIIVVLFSIIGSANYDRTVMDTIAWIVAIVLLVLCLVKAATDGNRTS